MKKLVSYLIPANGQASMFGEAPHHPSWKWNSEKFRNRSYFGPGATTMSNGPDFGGGGARTMASNRQAPTGSAPAANGANQNSTTLANAILQLANSNSGVVNFDRNTKTLATPDSTQFSATSTFNTTGTGAKTIAVTIFNQGINGLTASATNNGAGAASIVYNYNDTVAGSTNGTLISYINGQTNKGDGNWCYGFNVMYQLNVGGTVSQSLIPLLNSNLQGIYNNGDSTQKFLYFNIQQAIRNTQFQGGLLTVVAGFNLPGWAQVSANLPAGDGATVNSTMTLSMTFMYRPVVGMA
jgi:hypothetical protein